MKKAFVLLAMILTFSTVFAESKNVIAQEEYLPAQIKSVNVNFNTGKVKIKSDHINKVAVEVCGDVGAAKPKISLSAGELTIKTKLFSSIAKNHYVTISVPYGFSFEDITLVTASASVSMDGVTCQRFKNTTTSGSLEIKNCNIKDYAKIASGGGNQKIEKTNAKSIVCSVVTGTINLKKCETNLVQLESVSGKIICEDLKNNRFEVQSTGGKVEANFSTMPSLTSFVKTTSGGIKLTFPKNSGYTATVSSKSGNFSDEFTNLKENAPKDFISEYKKGGVEFKLETYNGNIEICKD